MPNLQALLSPLPAPTAVRGADLAVNSQSQQNLSALMMGAQQQQNMSALMGVQQPQPAMPAAANTAQPAGAGRAPAASGCCGFRPTAAALSSASQQQQQQQAQQQQQQQQGQPLPPIPVSPGAPAFVGAGDPNACCFGLIDCSDDNNEQDPLNRGVGAENGEHNQAAAAGAIVPSTQQAMPLTTTAEPQQATPPVSLPLTLTYTHEQPLHALQSAPMASMQQLLQSGATQQQQGMQHFLQLPAPPTMQHQTFSSQPLNISSRQGLRPSSSSPALVTSLMQSLQSAQEQLASLQQVQVGSGTQLYFQCLVSVDSVCVYA